MKCMSVTCTRASFGPAGTRVSSAAAGTSEALPVEGVHGDSLAMHRILVRSPVTKSAEESAHGVLAGLVRGCEG